MRDGVAPVGDRAQARPHLIGGDLAALPRGQELRDARPEVHAADVRQPLLDLVGVLERAEREELCEMGAEDVRQRPAVVVDLVEDVQADRQLSVLVRPHRRGLPGERDGPLDDLLGQPVVQRRDRLHPRRAVQVTDVERPHLELF
ncbi:hypothetical protein [Actinomadura flavalba]|uniref:hypothetical protein n=1 Tax=Actinomadura flavalba TaxID=1120938 RepID=UPI000374C71A|nr:hypothetical protein [Actinomadura flavalba]